MQIFQLNELQMKKRSIQKLCKNPLFVKSLNECRLALNLWPSVGWHGEMEALL